LEHVAVDGLVVPALELELLEGPETHVGEHFTGTRGDGALGRTVDSPDDDLVTAGQAVAGKRQGAALQLHRADAAAADDLRHAATGRVHREQRMLAGVLRGDVQGVSIGRYRDAVRGPVPVRGHFAAGTACNVQRHDAEAVRLEARALHRPV